MMDMFRHIWAWLAAFVAMFNGALDFNNILALLGIFVALLTIVERVYAIRLKRRQLGDETE